MKLFDSAALKRAVRTFVQAAIAVYGAPQLLDVLTGSAPVDVSLARTAVVSGIAAVTAYAWNAWLDKSPVPSLTP